MDELLIVEEFDMVIKRIKCGKVVGLDGILFEVWKYGGVILRNKFL